MKKVISYLLVASLGVSLVACGQKDVQTEEPVQEQVQEQAPDIEPEEIVSLPALEELPVETDVIFDGSERRIFKTGFGSLQEVTNKLLNFQKEGLYATRTVANVAEDGLYLDAHSGYAKNSSYITFSDDSGKWLNIIVSHSTESFSDVNSFSLSVVSPDAISDVELNFVGEMLTSIFGEAGNYIINGSDIDGLYIKQSHEAEKAIPANDIEEFIALGEDVQCYFRREWLDEKNLFIDCIFSSVANVDIGALNIVSDDMQLSFDFHDVYNVPTITNENVLTEFNTVVSTSELVKCVHIAELVKLRQDDCELARIGFALPVENDSYINVKFTSALYNTGDIALSIKAQSYPEFAGHAEVVDNEHDHEHEHEDSEIGVEEFVEDIVEEGVPEDAPSKDPNGVPEKDEVVQEIITEPQPYMTKQTFVEVIIDLIMNVLPEANVDYDGENTLTVTCKLFKKDFSTTLQITEDDSYNFYLNKV